MIHLNSPNFYFNITRTATFNGVIFDGLNSLGIIERTRFEGSKVVKDSYRIPYWPSKMCQYRQMLIQQSDKYSTKLIETARRVDQSVLAESEKKGYGHLPMEPLLNSRDFMYDPNLQA